MCWSILYAVGRVRSCQELKIIIFRFICEKKLCGGYRHLNYCYCYCYCYCYYFQKKVVVEKEGVKKDVSFRKILLNKCQKEFEREKSVEKTIHEKLEDLTKQGLSVSTNAQLPCNKTLAG